MSPKENLLAMLQGEETGEVINGWEPFEIVMNPVTLFASPLCPGKTLKDAWGVMMSWPKGQPGVMPLEGEHTVCPDIEKWKETLKAPDIASMKFDWAPFIAWQEEAHKKEKMTATLVPVGNFELMHNLMGFENCLMNLILEPEMMYEIAEYIANYRMECYRQICENLHPDILLQHDDWGAKENLLMNPDVWRKIFKPFYKKLYGYLHEQGVLIMHHADSYLEPIIPDMEELGIDIWQGILPQNDIPKIQSHLTTNMILMGGLDAAVIDAADCPEEVIRKEVRRACELYVPGGHFIPATTAGGPGSLHPEIDPIISDEIQKYSEEYSQ